MFYFLLVSSSKSKFLGWKWLEYIPLNMTCSDGSHVWDMTSQKTVTRSNVSQIDPHELELVGGLEHEFYLSINWECHHPN